MHFSISSDTPQRHRSDCLVVPAVVVGLVVFVWRRRKGGDDPSKPAADSG